MFSGVVSSMAWSNGNIQVPWGRAGAATGAGRRLLSSAEAAASAAGALEPARNLITWFGALILPVFIAHYAFVRWTAAYKPRLRPKGLLDFPQLPLTIALMLVNPFTSAAARIFSLESAVGWAVPAGLAFLFLVPIPVITFMVVRVRGLQSEVAQLKDGRWFGNARTLERYGSLLKDVQGIPHCWTHAGAVWDRRRQKFVVAHPERENLQTSWIARARMFFVPYECARNALIILLLGGFDKPADASVQGNLAQVSLLLAVTVMHFGAMIVVRPLATAHATTVELLTTLGEMGTYAAAFTLVLVRRLAPEKLPEVMPPVDMLLLAAQLFSVAGKIVKQAGALVMLMPVLYQLALDKLRPDECRRRERGRVLAFKYADRWYYAIRGAHLPSRAHFYRSRESSPPPWESQGPNFIQLRYMA